MTAQCSVITSDIISEIIDELIVSVTRFILHGNRILVTCKREPFCHHENHVVAFALAAFDQACQVVRFTNNLDFGDHGRSSRSVIALVTKYHSQL